MMELLLEILAAGCGFAEAEVSFGGKLTSNDDGTWRWTNERAKIDQTFATWRELDAWLWGFDRDDESQAEPWVGTW